MFPQTASARCGISCTVYLASESMYKFLSSTRVHTTNCTSIGSAILVALKTNVEVQKNHRTSVTTDGILCFAQQWRLTVTNGQGNLQAQGAYIKITQEGSRKGFFGYNSQTVISD